MFCLKKILNAFVAAFAVVCLMSISVLAADAIPEGVDIWDGSVAAAYASGTGTEADPYIITNGSELALLMQDINSSETELDQATEGKYYKLMSDIALNDVGDFSTWSTTAPANEWTPGGSVTNYVIRGFAGHFDGNYHNIYGLYVDSDDGYNGLFGYILNGHVENVGIKYAYVKGKNSTAAIAGYVRASDESLADGAHLAEDLSVGATFIGCSVDANSVIVGTSNVGGICGYTEAFGNKVLIRNCTNAAKVTAQYNYAGGIAGSVSAYGIEYNNDGNYAVEITNCVNSGDIKGNTGVGGIMGSSKDFVASVKTTDMIALLIKNCINSGAVLTTADYRGAVAGTVGPADRADSSVVTDLLDCYSISSGTMTKVYGNSLSATNATSSKLFANAGDIVGAAKTAGYDFDKIWTVTEGGVLPSLALIGDVLNDGAISAEDFVAAIGAIAGKAADVRISAIDFDGNGVYDLADINAFMSYLGRKGAKGNSLDSAGIYVVESYVKQSESQYLVNCFDPSAGRIETSVEADKAYEMGTLLYVKDGKVSDTAIYGNVFEKGNAIDVNSVSVTTGYESKASYNASTGALTVADSDVVYTVTDDTVITFTDKSMATIKIVEDDILDDASKVYHQNDDKSNPLRLVICYENDGEENNKALWIMIVRD